METVIKQGSLITGGTAADLVSSNVYDQFGREQYKYLPSPANNTGGNTSITDGNFKSNPFQQQTAFYVNTNSSSPIAGQGETYFYSKTNFEASPLNRPEKSLAPGNSWVGNNRGVDVKYWINTAIDEVRIWNVTNVANTFGTYASPGIYPAGELYKTVSVDEHGKQVIEFKDKEGKLILKKIQIDPAVTYAGLGKNNTGWLCTYYLYDDLNNLRCVIQPRGVELISPGFLLSDATILGEQCFRYE